MNLRRILPSLLLLPVFAFCQTPIPSSVESSPKTEPAAKPPLTTFDLDFPGGTPQQLVDAVQQAMRRPLNAIIPSAYASYRLPPLRMRSVTAPQLFQALSEARVLKSEDNRTWEEIAGFRTPERSNTSDQSIWYFFVQGGMPMAKATRFYQLGPYLEHGLTVDDITTAIQTSWKMRGESPTPQLSFHRETKLLIAVGSYSGLDTIDLALKALDSPAKQADQDSPAAASREKKP